MVNVMKSTSGRRQRCKKPSARTGDGLDAGEGEGKSGERRERS